MPVGDQIRRHDTRTVTGVDAGLLDVLHDPADDNRAGGIRDGVDIELERVFEELVDQHRVLGRGFDSFGHISVERTGIVDDGHRAAAEDIRRPHDEGVADLGCHLPRFGARGRDAARRLRDPEIPQQAREPLAVLGQIDRVGRGAEYGHPRPLQIEGKLQRRLPAELDDARYVAARGPFLLDDRRDVFQGERLEVESVDRVVVSRHRLGVGVDHHGLEAFVRERGRRVTTAVVELDPLPDPVGPRAQDDDLATVGRGRLALPFIGPVHIRVNDSNSAAQVSIRL